MLNLEGLETRYGSVAALKDISIRVGTGEIVGVLGPNGAGKTTTLLTVIGLLKPAAGRIRFLDRDIAGLAPTAWCRRGSAWCRRAGGSSPRCPSARTS